jgi:DNA-binding IclR family transcriptional regulator
MLNDKTDGNGVKTVELTMAILEQVMNGRKFFTVASLADELAIKKDKAVRIITTLEKRGFLERQAGSGACKAGPAAVAFAQRVLKSTPIIDLVQPVMAELAAEHDEAVYLAVLSGEEVLFLHLADCSRAVRIASLVGCRFPPFRNAAGRLIKALGSGDLEKYFKTKGKRVPRADLDLLLTELAAIRRQGYALDTDGLGVGVHSAAVAIRDYTGRVIGALTLVAPAFRLSKEQLRGEIIPSLRKKADELSARFGYESDVKQDS